jgi:hypothetical protein
LETGAKQKTADSKQLNRRFAIFIGFASLRWNYPTGSRGHPQNFGISQPVQLPQQI